MKGIHQRFVVTENKKGIKRGCLGGGTSQLTVWQI